MQLTDAVGVSRAGMNLRRTFYRCRIPQKEHPMPDNGPKELFTNLPTHVSFSLNPQKQRP
jgi:hypothetical protein